MKKNTKKSPKRTKSAAIKLQPKNPVITTVLLVVFSLAAGVALGYFLPKGTDTFVDPRYELASQEKITAAKHVITDRYSVCAKENEPISPDESSRISSKYLKVNKYGNRAVIRTCDHTDMLLAKNPLNGKWEETTVNISLDTRANSAWQHECLIDDITTTDTITRSENQSIDTFNFVDCRKLLEREQIFNILSENWEPELGKITQKDIDEYTQWSEDF